MTAKSSVDEEHARDETAQNDVKRDYDNTHKNHLDTLESIPQVTCSAHDID